MGAVWSGDADAEKLADADEDADKLARADEDADADELVKLALAAGDHDPKRAALISFVSGTKY